MNHPKRITVSVTAPVRRVDGNADLPDEIMDGAPDQRARRTGTAQAA
jgi:hypothetical protein